MILLSGTLQTGTPLTQAFLRCELGVFAVLDERLTSISAGNYPGLFEVEAIQPHSLPSDDGVIRLGVVAVLKRFSLALLEQPKKTAVKKSRLSSVNATQCALFTEEEGSSASRIESDEISDNLGEDPLENTPVSVINESPDYSPSITGEAASVSEQESGAAPAVMAMTAEDRALFGDRFVLSATVQLDATESREQLCQQRDRLKQLGYRFNAQQQVWERGESIHGV